MSPVILKLKFKVETSNPIIFQSGTFEYLQILNCYFYVVRKTQTSLLIICVEQSVEIVPDLFRRLHTSRKKSEMKPLLFGRVSCDFESEI